jgi:hypothetical protein
MKGPPAEKRSGEGRTRRAKTSNPTAAEYHPSRAVAQLGNGSYFADGTPERKREVAQMFKPANRAFAELRRIRREKPWVKFTILAMSWEALRWAAQQRAGDLAASAVLRVLADHASKTGRTFVDSKTICEELGTTKPTVLDAIGRIIARGLMEDTGERVGKTGSVRVFQLKMALETNKERSNSFTAKRSRSGKEAVKKQSNSFTADAGETASNLKPLTIEEEEAHSFSSSSSIKKDEEKESNSRGALRRPTEDEKNFRPCLSRPKDTGEVWEYIYNANDDHPEEETASLVKYFSDLAGPDENDAEGDRDIEYWLHINERNGWRGVTDWHVHLKETFLRGWFPSQKRKAKRRLK